MGTTTTADTGPERSKPRASPDLSDYPVREYVAAMAAELAQMAEWDGDSALSRMLEAAAEMASRAPEGRPVPLDAARGKRAARA